jgi:phospholipid transport system substrate-binding protein
MKLIRTACIVFFIAAAPAGATTVAADPEATPHALIETTAKAVSERLDGRKSYFDDNPGELYALINEVLLPVFDTRYAGRLVLGKHWKGASKEQRDRFIDVFYRFLAQSYANGILEFEQGSIEVLPPDEEANGKRVVVKTRTFMDDGSEIPINYSMRKTSAGWRVYDVRIEGVSYVQNYRNQFNAEIAALGVDAVIERLNTEVAAAAAAEAAP